MSECITNISSPVSWQIYSDMAFYQVIKRNVYMNLFLLFDMLR